MPRTLKIKPHRHGPGDSVTLNLKRVGLFPTKRSESESTVCATVLSVSKLIGKQKNLNVTVKNTHIRLGVQVTDTP